MNRIKLIPIAASLAILFQSNTSLAEELPHIAATPDCPTGQTCCPSEIYCSYSEGCGESGFWLVDGQAVSPFEGVQQFSLSGILASISNDKDKTYWYYCQYGSQYSYIRLIDAPYKLSGSWQYFDFGNHSAKCNSSNSLDCTGIKQTLSKEQENSSVAFTQSKGNLGTESFIVIKPSQI